MKDQWEMQKESIDDEYIKNALSGKFIEKYLLEAGIKTICFHLPRIFFINSTTHAINPDVLQKLEVINSFANVEISKEDDISAIKEKIFDAIDKNKQEYISLAKKHGVWEE